MPPKIDPEDNPSPRRRHRARGGGQLVINNRYVVDKPLGKGETSAVFSAIDARLHRKVTLKMLPRDAAADPAVRAHFFAEAQLYATMHHNGVMSIYDVCAEDASTPWMALEHIDGVTMTQALRARRQASSVPQANPFSPAQAIALLTSSLEGLRHAHARNIIHRDINPATLTLSEEGHIRLVDFSLAVGTDFTVPARGTAHFYSPEHVRGLLPDARSDVYSLTCVFFALLTGRPPFLGGSPGGVAQAHLTEPPPKPSEFAPDIPEWVDTLVQCGLSKDPAMRFRHAGQMHDELLMCQLLAQQHHNQPTIPAREHIISVISATRRVFGATGHQHVARAAGHHPSTGQHAAVPKRPIAALEAAPLAAGDQHPGPRRTRRLVRPNVAARGRRFEPPARRVVDLTDAERALPPVPGYKSETAVPQLRRQTALPSLPASRP